MVTLSEFGEIAYLKPAFFELGLRIVSDRKCVMHTINGEAELVIGLPEGGEQRRYLTSVLSHKDAGPYYITLNACTTAIIPDSS